MKSNAPLTASEIRAEWERQCRSLLDFINQLADVPSFQGVKWQAGMIKHYRAKLMEMTEDPPSRCGKRADNMRSECHEAIIRFNERVNKESS